MNQVNQYTDLIKEALTTYAALLTQDPNPAYEVVLLFDDEHQQYMIRKLGWKESKRVNYIPLHVTFRNGKIWIEEDWTEEGIATYFLAHNVPHQDIVLGFQPPVIRPYTEFCV